MQITPEMVKVAGWWKDLVERKTRDNGETFVTVNADVEHPFKDAIYSLHGDMAPKDRLFALAAGAVERLATLDAYAETDDAGAEWADGETPVYNTDRTAWLAEDLSHGELVNDTVENFGVSTATFDIFELLGTAIHEQARHVWDTMVSALADAVVGDECDPKWDAAEDAPAE